jgi:acyl carrier protein
LPGGSDALGVPVVTVNAADRDELARVLAEHPELTAVVHTAGAPDPVRGAVNLDELTRDRDLSAFVLVAAVDDAWGGAGRTATAEAAACFDALAARRAADGVPAVSVATADLPGLCAAVGRRSVGAVTPVVDWAAFVPAFTEVRASALFHELPEAARHLPDAAADEPEIDSPGVLRQRLLDATGTGFRDVLAQLVRVQTAIVLGLPSPAAVDDDAEFLDVGFSSLTAVELRQRLSHLTGVELPVALVYEYATPAEVTDHLAEVVAADLTDAPALGTAA